MKIKSRSTWIRICASCILVLLLLSSCTGPSGSASNTTEGIGEQPTTLPEADNERLLVSDDLPELDFGGAEFRSIIQEGAKDIYIESEVGEVVDDAIYHRNKRVEERLNVRIMPPRTGQFSDISTILNASVRAGDDEYDVYYGMMTVAGGDALGGIFQNWYDIPYMDFSKPWYPLLMVDELTINGRMFISAGDMLLSNIGATYCMFFDKALAIDWNIPDMYQLVSDGKWTVDKLIELTKDVYTDLNGNGNRDEEDFYGFTTDLRSHAVVYLWAFDQPTVIVNDENEIELTFDSDRTYRIIDKLRELISSNGSITSRDFNFDTRYFAAGKVIFANSALGEAVTAFKGLESDFGIIPYPKLDENQAMYKTMIDGISSIMAVPTTARNTEMIGAVTTALNAESWKTVIPAYYDVALKLKGVRDEQSVAMIDLILAGRSIDFAFVYDFWRGFSFTISDLIDPDNNVEVSSLYAARQNSVRKHYQQVLDLFMRVD